MKTTLKTELVKCHLCKDAPCAKACNKLDLNDIIHGIWFNNEKYIVSTLPEVNPCLACSNELCNHSCLAKHKVDIKTLISKLYELKKDTKPIKLDEKKLEITFLGKKLINPFLLSSSIVSSDYDKCARAFKAGWAGACLKTISDFKINETSPRYCSVIESPFGVIGFKNIEQLSQRTIEEDMKTIRRLKKDFPDRYIIASIMSTTKPGWATLAKQAQDAGADCVELNFSCPNMEDKRGGASIGLDTDLCYELTKIVKDAVSIPVLVKPTPNVTDMVPVALAAKKAGADGLACINTVFSMQDVGYSNVKEESIGGLSGPIVRPLALRFISQIKQNKQTFDLAISGMGGIENWSDALNYLVLGCSSLQVTTAVMLYGQRIINQLKEGLLYYMETHGISSVNDLVGRDLHKVIDLDKRDRDTIYLPHFNRSKCIGCGRCVIACADGGHCALSLNKDRMPILDPKKCVGCHLCKIVCPNDVISGSTTRFKQFKK